MLQLKAGFALCGSFCTFSKVIPKIEELVEQGVEVVPIMSFAAHNMDTRFGKAKDFCEQLETITGNAVLSTIEDTEPVGPKKMFDILIVAPCTGNTLGKLASGIIDTPVTMAVKSHLRNLRPVLLGVSTNDSLSASAKNIGQLLNYKHIYFIPIRQDDPEMKPNSMIADLTLLSDAMELALKGVQMQPLMLGTQ